MEHHKKAARTTCEIPVKVELPGPVSRHRDGNPPGTSAGTGNPTGTDGPPSRGDDPTI